MSDLYVSMLCVALGFILGVIMGIYDTKRTYGIPHKVAPEDCEVIINEEP